MNSQQYWRDRELKWQQDYAQNQAFWDSQVWGIYQQLQKDMQTEIDHWYSRYAGNNGLTLADAKKTIDAADQDYYAGRAKYLVGLAQQDFQNLTKQNAGIYFSQQANEDMELYNAAMKITRMQLIQSMLDVHVDIAMGKTQTAIEQAATEAAQNVFLNMSKVLGSTVIGNIERIPSLVNASFHGATFSNRIWKTHSPGLKQGIQNALSRALILGESPDRFRRALIAESTLKTRAAFKAARTLLNTEFCRVQISAESEVIKTIGMSEYEYIANPGCCTACQGLNGKIYKLKGSMPSTDLPPMHPNCRCSIAPYSDRKEYEEWLDSYTKHGMDWEEWKDWKDTGFDEEIPAQKDVDKAEDAAKKAEEAVKKATDALKAANDAANKAYVELKDAEYEVAHVNAELLNQQYRFQKVKPGGKAWKDAQAKIPVLQAKLQALEKERDLKKAIADKAQDKADKADKKLANAKKKLDTANKKLAKANKKLGDIKIKKIDAKISAQEKVLNTFNKSKAYSGLWKNDVTIQDYDALKDKISNKRQHIEGEIAAGKNVTYNRQLLTDLAEFEAVGKAYWTHYQKLKDLETERTKIEAKYLGNDPYSQERKNKAYWFTKANGGAMAADKVLRPTIGKVWQKASKEEREAAYKYTYTYARYNEPLRGIEYGTSQYKGVGNVDFDTIGVSYAGFAKGEVRKEIQSITNIIDKCTYNHDMWFNRGCRFRGMEKFFNCDADLLRYGTDADLQVLVGKTPIEYGFMSVGDNKGGGFTGDIILNIYAPAGTKYMYCEPFSHYGQGAQSASWDGISGQSSIGYEAECLMQRGTKMRVTKIYKKAGTIFVDLDVIGQLEGPNV